MRFGPKVAAFAVLALVGADYVNRRDGTAAIQQLQAAGQQFRAGLQAGEDAANAKLAWRNAANAYQELVDSGYDSPELYLNLGNSYYLADEMPKAILAYRLGLRHHPLHARLWENLEAARDLVGYTDGAPRHRPADDDWPPFLPRPSPDRLLHIAVAVYSLGWVAVGVWLVWRFRLAATGGLLLLFAGALAFGWWAYLDYSIARESQQPLAIVAANGVSLRRGNGALFPRHPQLSVVNRGMEAKVLTARGGWVQLQFPGGEIGWLPRETVVTE